MTNKDINGLDFTKSRMELINKFEELKELGLRSQNAIDDAKMADKSIKLLQKRSRLIESLQKAKSDIIGCIYFDTPAEDVTKGSTISVKVSDLDGYRHNAAIISNSQTELKKIDAAIRQLADIGANYFKDVLRDTETAKRKVQSIQQEIIKLTRLSNDDAKREERMLKKDLAVAEAELKAKQDVLDEQNSIYGKCEL